MSHARVCWIFSLARCGSSVTAYAGAAPWRVPVADEPFGSWDRTGPPYNYPPEQAELVRLYQETGEHITPAVVELATTVLDKIAGPAGRVVAKHPHDMIDPDEFHASFPDHYEVYLLRHPLVRLNSLYTRGWHRCISEHHDLERFKLVAGRWLEAPYRLTYESLVRDPRGFFKDLWSAWEWEFSEDDVDAAIAYQRTHYHMSSRRLSDDRPEAVRAETEWNVPDEAVRAYLDDPFVREVMAEAGWSAEVPV